MAETINPMKDHEVISYFQLEMMTGNIILSIRNDDR